jgi:hypothetical protein
VFKHAKFSSNRQKFQQKLTFFKVILKQICDAHMFNHYAVFPATTSSAGSHPSSCWCHYSRDLAGYVIMLLYTYPNSFTQQSPILPEKTPKQVLK